MMNQLKILLGLLLLPVFLMAQKVQFAVRVAPELHQESVDGRLLVLISTNSEQEPRFQIADGPGTQQVFGIDVEGWSPGAVQRVGQEAYGYPVEALRDFPEGAYYVQVLFHHYETFERADGHTVKLPMDRGEGQQWNRAPGNWYSTPRKMEIAACPDPIDFRAYCLVNLYEDENAYYLEGPFRSTLRPGHRDYLGQVDATLRDMNLRELALGSRGRSGQQWDIWEAVYSPVDTDGYPKRIWDKQTGEIDPEVAAYWRENYDLSYILYRDWAELGPKLQYKIHIYCGDMDNYYLNNAVYLAEDILEATQPYYAGEVAYGDRAEHCWNGDPEEPNHISRLRYHPMFIQKWVAEDMPKVAPEGADLDSWRY